MVRPRIFDENLPPFPWPLGRFKLSTDILAAVYDLYLLAYVTMPEAYPLS